MLYVYCIQFTQHSIWYQLTLIHIKIDREKGLDWLHILYIYAVFEYMPVCKGGKNMTQEQKQLY